MLDVALKFLADEINNYLKARTGIAEDIVALTPVVDEAGKYLVPSGGVSLVLINIEEEAVTREQLPDHQYRNGQYLRLEPELKLNLFLMFAANFSVYDQALKYLSHILTFFQAKRIFVPETYPALNSNIRRLAMDLQTLNYDQLNQIWAYIGGKHLPSIIYRARLISIQDQAQSDLQPPLTIVESNMRSL